MNEKKSILIIDGDVNTRKMLKAVFDAQYYESRIIASMREAIMKAESRRFNLALIDIELLNSEGIDPLDSLKKQYPNILIIVMTVYDMLETAVLALNKGASDYIIKPLNRDEVLFKVRSGLEKQRLLADRRRLEDSLQETESRYWTLMEQSGDGIYVLVEGIFEIINTKFSEMFKVTQDDVRSSDFNFLDLVVPQSRYIFSQYNRVGEGGIHTSQWYEFIARDTQGREFEVEASTATISHRGKPAIQGILRDVSEWKILEAQFRQAQKMEAVGRLAGGIAHDFNNLLTVISGNSNLALMSLNPEDPINHELRQIDKAAQKASRLASQLLAFSRKQTWRPTIIDLNFIIRDVDKMLRRLIGEDIDFITRLSPDLWKVKVNLGQIEQVIFNLAVNARDAMPEGGKLTVETANIELKEGFFVHGTEVIPGPYVILSVSDTGCGMTEEVKSQAFNPFFTTKGEGVGTGLGLSTVFGIVKQSDGYIRLNTEPDKGTTFNMYIPGIKGKPVADNQKVDLSEISGGNETILVVEDEDDVRYMAVRILKLYGYKVKEARSGSDALRICGKLKNPLDLIIADVIMPNMKGTKLVKIIREKYWPDIKVLYISGYMLDRLLQIEFFDYDAPYLQKPFDIIVLAQKVREVLDK